MDSSSVHTPTALRRWSCQDRQLPPVSQIKNIHVYDFDNTLFRSPLPNRQVWNTSTIGQIQGQDFLVNGGWWHNPAILAATGDGLEKEEARGWEGCWNENIVELVRLSMSEEDTLCVLLTGRQEAAFGELIGRMIASRKLQFDIVALRPSIGPTGQVFSSTMAFKQTLLKELIYTYAQASEIRVYEDRPKHTKGFRDYFNDLNMAIMTTETPRDSPITAEVVQVSEQDSYMNPVTEVAEVQRMVNGHNQAVSNGTSQNRTVPFKIKRSVFYTGYIISPADTERLKQLVVLPPNCPEHEVRYLANNIMITPRPAPSYLLKQVGGIGAILKWRITGIATYEQRVWAAKVEPVPAHVKTYTENHTPCVVLATRRQSKPIEASRIRNWQPVPADHAIEFETTVGEKVLLRIEEEIPGEDTYEASFPNARNAKKHAREEDFPPLGSERAKQRQPDGQTQHRSNHDQRQQHGSGPAAWQNRGGAGIGFAAQRGGSQQGRGGARGGQRNFSGQKRGSFQGGRGRGRGGYKSLDDQRGQAGYGDAGAMQY